MCVEGSKPEAMIASILSRKGLFLKTIGAEPKDTFGIGKESMPATTSWYWGLCVRWFPSLLQTQLLFIFLSFIPFLFMWTMSDYLYCYTVYS